MWEIDPTKCVFDWLYLSCFSNFEQEIRVSWSFRWGISLFWDSLPLTSLSFQCWKPKFLLESILFLLVLLCWKYFCQCARLREEKEEEINFSWKQFYSKVHWFLTGRHIFSSKGWIYTPNHHKEILRYETRTLGLIETNKYQAWGSNPRPHRSTTLGKPTTLGDQPSKSEQIKIIR